MRTTSPLFKGFESAIRVLQWHGDAFDLPADATLLATSPVCGHQAFAFGNAYGIMFHLELSPEMVRGLADVNRAWTHEHFDLDEAKYRLGFEAAMHPKCRGKSCDDVKPHLKGKYGEEAWAALEKFTGPIS